MKSLMRLVEWEEQSSIWLCYPSHMKHWGDNLAKIRDFCLKLLELISKFQPIDILFNDTFDLKSVEQKFSDSNFPVKCHYIEHNDIWIRDYGPIFMNDVQKLKILKFGFNAWGEKFLPFDLDDDIPIKLAKKLNLELEQSDLIIEGGALEFNGAGIALSTVPCLTSVTRNPKFSIEEIE